MGAEEGYAFTGLEPLENRTLMSAAYPIGGSIDAGPAPRAVIDVASRAKKLPKKLPAAFTGIFNIAITGFEAALGPFAFAGTITVKAKGASYIVTAQDATFSGTIVKWTIKKATNKVVKVTGTTVGTAVVDGETHFYDLTVAGKFKKVAGGASTTFGGTISGKEQGTGTTFSANFTATVT